MPNQDQLCDMPMSKTMQKVKENMTQTNLNMGSGSMRINMISWRPQDVLYSELLAIEQPPKFKMHLIT